MKILYKTLVQTVVFDDIETDADVDFSFKLEIFKGQNDKFYGQLYRKEMYSFTCSFEDMTPDELVYVLDIHTVLDLDEREFSSIHECLEYTIKSLEKTFCLN